MYLYLPQNITLQRISKKREEKKYIYPIRLCTRFIMHILGLILNLIIIILLLLLLNYYERKKKQWNEQKISFNKFQFVLFILLATHLT